MPAGLSGTLANAWRSVSDTVLRGWNGEINHLMRAAPRPLIHPDAKMIVLFSAKSACSTVVIWFFHQLGLARKAQDYDPWPHRFRSDVYYSTDLYRNACKLDLTDFKVVRVVRNSFDRAASSFRHAQRAGLTDADFARLLGRPDAAEAGVSFCEFLDLLERIDLRTCDIHYSLQRHPIEDKLPVTHLIDVSTEDLFTRLNEVEADLGLPHTDFSQLDWIHSLDRHRLRNDAIMQTDDAYNLRLTREYARRGPWPSSSALLTPEARERIAHLYAEDVKAYGQSTVALAKHNRAPAPVRDPEAVRAERRALRLRRMERRDRKRRSG